MLRQLSTFVNRGIFSTILHHLHVQLIRILGESTLGIKEFEKFEELIFKSCFKKQNLFVL